MKAFLDFIEKNWGEVLSVFHLMQASKSGGNVPDDASPRVKALAKGFFGTGDEIDLQRILLTLGFTEKEVGKILAFQDWYYDGKGIISRRIANWRKSTWRVMVTQLDSEVKQAAEKKSTVKHKDKDGKLHETTTTMKFTNPSYETETVLFLRKVLQLIDSGRTRKDGYEKVAAYLQSTNFSPMPDMSKLESLEEALGKAPEKVRRTLEDANTWAEKKVEDNAKTDAKRNTLMRFLLKLMGTPTK